MNNEKCFFKLLRGVEVYAPDKLGCQDILIAGNKIAAIGSKLEVPASWNCELVDLNGLMAVPGFLDVHVHMIGGGGEGGYATRTPEIQLGDVIRAGVTTVMGCLGTDGTTRHMTSLLAKARALETEGVSTYIYTGSYEIPVNTITRNVREDIVLIDKVIGCGEIAISDHRSAQPTKEDIIKLAAQCRTGGMISSKAGILQLHLGNGKNRLNYLFDIVEQGEIPITQFLPTHINRDPQLMEEGIRFAKLGGTIDFTSSIDNMRAKDAVRYCLEQGVPLANMTMSSDGNGSMPNFNEQGKFIGLQVAKMDSLFKEIKALVLEGTLELAEAIKIVTENPAQLLKLYPQKGCLKVGSDADIVILDKDINLNYVFAKGNMMIADGKQQLFGTYEKHSTTA